MPRGVYNRSKTARATASDTSIGAAITSATVASDVPQEAPKPLSVRIVRMVDGIRSAFNDFTAEFKKVSERRAEFAPKFMKVFHAWQGETEGTFVAFVRVLVPELPMDTKGYKAHAAHIAADNLRSLYNRLERGKKLTPVERAKAIQNKPVAPRAAYTRLMAAFLPLIDDTGKEALRKAMSEQLHWTEAQIKGIFADSDETTPLVRVKPPRGVHIDHTLKLVPGPVPVAEKEDVAA